MDEWKPRYGLRFPLWGVHEFVLFRFVKKSEKRKVGIKFVFVAVVVPNLRRKRVENSPVKCLSTSVYIDVLVESYGVSH